MKCKVCNNELIRGTQKCPYCGALVPPVGKTSSDEFKWNVQDYPKPKKHQDVSIDWNSGRILDKDSGKVYDQSLNSWTEPDELGDLFSFDTKNEKLQLALDKEMDKLSGNTATERRRQIRSDNMFHLPASMDFRMSDELSALLNDTDIEEKIPEKNDDRSLEEMNRQPQKNSAAVSERKTERKDTSASAAPAFDFHRFSDAAKSDKASKAPSKTTESYADSMRSLHNAFSEVFGDSGDKKKRTFESDSFGKNQARYEDSAGSGYSKISETHSEEKISKSVRENNGGDGFNAKDTLEASKTDKTGIAANSQQDTSLSQGLSFLSRDSLDLGTQPDAKKDDVTDAQHDSEVEFLGFSRLIEAEKRFKEDMEKVTFLSPSEYEEAEKAETQSQKLRFVPTISFRTIEDEYESYRRENNIPKAAKNEDKKVQIKINEPSGTKVTVQTQEISLASLANREKIKTKEVCLDAVKQPPKNVQVSVEVNAAQGNASVEVTRRHDGATVVKTMDKPDSGHLYVNGEDLTDYSDIEISANTDNLTTSSSSAAASSAPKPVDKKDLISAADTVNANTPNLSRDLKPDDIADGSASSEAAQQTLQIPAATAEALAAMIAAKKAWSQADMEDSPDAKDSDKLKESGTRERQPSGISDRGAIELDSNFWEISDDISKMTITDIFGPDAHKIIEEGRKQNAANTAVQNADDLAVPAGSTIKAEKQSEVAPVQEEAPVTDHSSTPAAASESVSKTDKAASEGSLILDIRPEDIAASRAQTDSIQMPVIDPDRGTRRVTTDTISQERQTEMQEAFDAIDTLKEAESKKRAKEEKIAERERQKAERAVQKAEKARLKAQKKAAKEEKKEEAADDENSLGPWAKGLIIALAAVLIIEFSVIGIKLFAPDSGAAVLIHRFESQITGIFSPDDNTSGSPTDGGQQQADGGQSDTSGS